MKILIADDMADDRMLLRYVAEANGHDVIEAGNGREGLEAATKQKPDEKGRIEMSDKRQACKPTTISSLFRPLRETGPSSYNCALLLSFIPQFLLV